MVGDQKSRRQQNTDTLQDGGSQCSAAVGDQVAGDLHGCRCAIPVDEAPLILAGIKRMAHTIVIRKPLALAVAFGVAAAVAPVAAPIVEAKKWIAVTGNLEFANDWEKTPLGGVFSLDWQLT
jgi:hypothetical protein